MSSHKLSNLLQLGKKKRKHQRRLMSGFLVFSVGILSYFVYLHTQSKVTRVSAERAFNSLELSYKKGGITKFLSKKQKLRTAVKAAMKTEGTKLAAATNIAVYMFPDLLPEDNFEKDVAEDLWVEQQQKIEKSPRTQQSRQQFESMRANIWNYETAGRDAISSEAKQVIRIYDLLSSQ